MTHPVHQYFRSAPQHRRATIVCTIGPSSSSPEVLLALAQAGMDVVRLNFSHGDYAQKDAIINHVRAIERKVGRPLAILQDLQGPKLRVGEMMGAKPALLEPGHTITITTAPCLGTAQRISVNYAQLPGDVKPGDPILLADGTIALRVLEVQQDDVHCEVVHGGLLLPRKGVNLPGVKLSIPALTPKDIKDVRYGVQRGVDWIALSFVRDAHDIVQLQRMIARDYARLRPAPAQLPPRVIAKIEKPEAVAQLPAIIAVADGVMVARGDLGVELRPEMVPVVQKEMIRLANAAGKPVITATQMLETMIHSPVATRAETSDVANAVFDGTDALMLSGETAAGDNPVAAVQVMAQIVASVEASDLYVPRPRTGAASTSDGIAQAAVQVARDINAACIAVFTHSGTTAMHLVHYRPMMPVIALCTNAAIARPLMLYWNLKTFTVPHCASRTRQLQLAERMVRTLGMAGPGKAYVVVSGSSFQSGGTNWVEVRTCGVTPDERK
jgi:pyruvate kinase